MSQQASSRRAWLRWLMPVATLALLAVFARSVDWRHAWEAIVHADPMLLVVATVANLASLVMKGVRWSVFLDGIGLPGVWKGVRATFAAAALNNVVVANGGDAARVAAMARRGNISSASVLATLAIDRLCDLVSYAVLFVVAAFALELPPELARWRTPGLVTLTAMAAITGLLAWRSSGGDAADASANSTSTFLSRAGQYWRRLISTTASVATRGRLLLAVVLSVVAWVGQWATYHYAAHAASFATTPATSVLALLAVNASFLVRLTPGNVGVFQLLYALAATSTGLDKDSAVAVAFLIQLIQYIPVTIVGLLLAPSLAGGKPAVAVAAPSRIDRDPAMTLHGEQERGA